MAEREKVIYDIERCICHVPDACRDCSHYGHGEIIGCMEEWLKDTLNLLKKQEAVEPTWRQGKAYCGSCGKRIPLKIGARYCHKCGKAVK